MSDLMKQCQKGRKKYGNIVSMEELKANLAMNCIPDGMQAMTAADYPDFLAKRRILMAQKIKTYFWGL